MTGYIEDISGFCTDPVAGERRTIDYIMLGAFIVASPVLLPLYYVGVLSSIILERGEDE